MIERIDPVDCACTDCLSGVSVPVNHALERDLAKLERGSVVDATVLSERDYERLCKSRFGY